MEKTDLTLLAYQQSQETAEESTRCLLAAFAYLGIPDSLIDLGCGPGHLVRLACRAGARFCLGVDANAPTGLYPTMIGESRDGQACTTGADYVGSWELWQRDLMEPLATRRTYSMALCWEVAEHLPPDAAPTLCDTATSVLAPGGTLLWSAATPGQGGAGHLNERPHAYWRHLLTERGLKYQGGMTDKLRRVFAEVAPRAWWYGKNFQVFKKPNSPQPTED